MNVRTLSNSTLPLIPDQVRKILQSWPFVVPDDKRCILSSLFRFVLARRRCVGFARIPDIPDAKWGKSA